MVEVSAGLFKKRYPEFFNLDEDFIDMVLAEASPLVDDGWEEVDQKPAVMALAAHILAQQGYPARGDGTDSGSGGFNPNPNTNAVLRRKVGDVETQYGSSSSAGASSTGNSAFEAELNQTVYGQAFMRFMRRNVNTAFTV